MSMAGTPHLQAGRPICRSVSEVPSLAVHASKLSLDRKHVDCQIHCNRLQLNYSGSMTARHTFFYWKILRLHESI